MDGQENPAYGRRTPGNRESDRGIRLGNKGSFARLGEEAIQGFKREKKCECQESNLESSDS
jgi:hypothetical protein